MPCGVQCAAACPTTTESPVEISHVDPECVDHPTGISQRFALYSDHEQLCNSFGFCRDGKYYEDDCIPGQYFDPSHRKFSSTLVPAVIAISWYLFKLVACPLMISHVVQCVPTHAKLSIQCVQIIQQESQYAIKWPLMVKYLAIHLDIARTVITSSKTALQDNTSMVAPVSYKYNSVPNMIIFKILASQLMIFHAELHVQIHAHLHHLTQCVWIIQLVSLKEWLHWMTTELPAVLILDIAWMATTSLNHVRQGNILMKKSVSDY